MEPVGFVVLFCVVLVVVLVVVLEVVLPVVLLEALKVFTYLAKAGLLIEHMMPNGRFTHALLIVSKYCPLGQYNGAEKSTNLLE